MGRAGRPSTSRTGGGDNAVDADRHADSHADRGLITSVGETVDFDSFQKVLNRPGGFRDPGEPEEYCRGFQVFDKDMTGFIGVGQLRYSGFFHLSAFVFLYAGKVPEREGSELADEMCDPPVLTNLGEKMSDDEVDELLKAVDTSSGEINYTGMSCSFRTYVCLQVFSVTNMFL